MLIVGLTGGIAAGKTSVLDAWRRHGAVTFSADEAARAVLVPGSEALRQLADRFGPSVLREDGSLDRGRLGCRAFETASATEALSRITHPPILELLRRQIEACRDLAPYTVVVAEVPLLFEAGMASWFERIAVVAASQPVQIARLARRSGIASAEALKRIAAQMPLQEKISRADYVIWNDSSLEDLAREADRIWTDLKAEARRRAA